METNTTKTDMDAVVDFILAATDRKDFAAIELGLAAKAELESDSPYYIALPKVLRAAR